MFFLTVELELEQRVRAQRIGVIAVLIAAGDLKNALRQQLVQ